MVISMVLHNFPEGFTTFVSVSNDPALESYDCICYTQKKENRAKALLSYLYSVRM